MMTEQRVQRQQRMKPRRKLPCVVPADVKTGPPKQPQGATRRPNAVVGTKPAPTPERPTLPTLRYFLSLSALWMRL